MRIAAFVDIEGNILPLGESGLVQVYEERNAEWYCINETPFYINKSMSLTDVRKSIYAMASDLGNCRALIVKRSIGIFQTIFEEELHIYIFPVPGRIFSELITQVRNALRIQFQEAIKKAETCKERGKVSAPAPIQGVLKDCYQINLVKVQEEHDSMSSKDILLPFFKNNKFTELEIICSHTPKWLEREFVNFGFSISTEIRKDGLHHVFVRPIG